LPSWQVGLPTSNSTIKRSPVSTGRRQIALPKARGTPSLVNHLAKFCSVSLDGLRLPDREGEADGCTLQGEGFPYGKIAAAHDRAIRCYFHPNR
jgi:hypothetical protein